MPKKNIAKSRPSGASTSLPTPQIPRLLGKDPKTSKLCFVTPPLKWCVAFTVLAWHSRLESYPAESKSFDDDRADCLFYCIQGASQISGWKPPGKCIWCCF